MSSYLSHNIAVNLQKIRKANKMSLDEVSEQTGVSKSMLAAIEHGGANPSIGVIGKIMSGLRVDLDDLVKSPDDDMYLVNINDLDPTKDEPGCYKVYTLFPIADNHTIELYRIEVEPGSIYVSGSHGDHTREYITVLEGVLDLEIGTGPEFETDALTYLKMKKQSAKKTDTDPEKKSVQIHPSECFRFESNCPHSYINRGNKKVVFISFFQAY